ncbi:MAG TPA: GxxExxY protein [Rudaea sp.]|uniref:GxxExxY protein n=1 Tax=Rudaea sp. TaxID=2136325 RepID=UPI002F9418CF
MELEQLSDRVIGCAIDVHRGLGPGLLESVYAQCLAFELARAGISFEAEKPIPVAYKDVRLDCGFRVDLMVENSLIVEAKAVEKLLPIHRAQLLTYMKVTQMRVGLLINFNCRTLREGLVRLVL